MKNLTVHLSSLLLLVFFYIFDLKTFSIVHAVGSHNGRVFYDRELQYILGEGSEYDLPDGVDKALKRVDKGEKCQVILKGSTFTYGSNPPPKFNLPLNAEITFVLFLKDFEKVNIFMLINQNILIFRLNLVGNYLTVKKLTLL